MMQKVPQQGSDETVRALDIHLPAGKKNAAAATILYGTSNPGKLLSMRKCLESLPITILGLGDMPGPLPEITEAGRTPLENARVKAEAYWQVFRLPVFSCDSGLFFPGAPEEIQPGVRVRHVNGRELTDLEMTDYYRSLAARYGKPVEIHSEDLSPDRFLPSRNLSLSARTLHVHALTAQYQNAICLILDDTHRYEAMDADMHFEPFYLVDRPHPDGIRQKGFPLDCLSVDIASGRYYFDLSEPSAGRTAENGFLRFVREALEQ